MYANNAYLELLNLPGKFNIEGLMDSDIPAETARYASLFQQHDRLAEQTEERRSSLEIHRFGKERQLSAYFFAPLPE